ncbi:MAG: hypothetical protein CBD32_02280 [Actinobacteria bacterium TMED172]|nr:hypothetical protein [Cellvibrionales bacterium]OUW33302.1 MAG: hypothetical protein CBD32_02280 [Actinobacteria bacterium TMED172]|tara:strand:- start:5888 stop:6658 length:771 start_codon:yes stop_codon:yes gene_type:complete
MIRNALVIIVFFLLAFVFDWLFFDRKGNFVTPEPIKEITAIFNDEEPSVKEIVKAHPLDCNEAGENAVTNLNLSEELRKIVSVGCWSFGHLFGPSDNKIWLYNLESSDMTIYPHRLVITADQRDKAADYDGEILDPLFHEAHFRKINHDLLTKSEDRKAFIENIPPSWQNFHFDVAKEDLSRLNRIYIETYSGDVIYLYIAELTSFKVGADERNASGFGYVCYGSDCIPDNVFRVIDVDEISRPEAFKGVIIPEDP